MYKAPEVHGGDLDGYSFEVDIWAFGVILYQLCEGILPFKTFIESIKAEITPLKR
jgi:serine/threonine protein kinase